MLIGEIEKRTDTQGVSCSEIINDSTLSFLTSDKHRVFSMKHLVQLLKIITQLHEQRQDDGTVWPGIDLKSILLPEFQVVVDFSVGDDSVLILCRENTERLFSLWRKIVNRQSMETDDAWCIQMNDGMVRASRLDLLEAGQLLRSEFTTVDNRPNSAHVWNLNICSVEKRFRLIVRSFLLLFRNLIRK